MVGKDIPQSRLTTTNAAMAVRTCCCFVNFRSDPDQCSVFTSEQSFARMRFNSCNTTAITQILGPFYLASLDAIAAVVYYPARCLNRQFTVTLKRLQRHHLQLLALGSSINIMAQGRGPHDTSILNRFGSNLFEAKIRHLRMFTQRAHLQQRLPIRT